MAEPWFRRYILPLAETYAVDPMLVEAVILKESGGHACAYRYEPEFYDRYLKGNAEYAGMEPTRVSASYGLCQVMYPTARERGFRGEPELLCVPQVNIDLGCGILSALLRWADGDVRKASAAYNGGRGNWAGKDPQAYAASVLARFDALKRGLTA